MRSPFSFQFDSSNYFNYACEIYYEVRSQTYLHILYTLSYMLINVNIIIVQKFNGTSDTCLAVMESMDKWM